MQGYISEFVSEKTVSIKRVDEGLEVMGKNLGINEGVSIGMTFNSAWHARVIDKSVHKIRPLEIKKDPLGLMFVSGGAKGDLNFLLYYDPGIGRWFGIWRR